MKTRITTLVLALLMLLSTVSCGEGNDQPTETSGSNTPSISVEEETTPEETVPEETEPAYAPEIRDMDGFTLNILHHNTQKMTWTEIQLDAEEVTGEIINDAIYERNERIMNDYNCVISVNAETEVTATLVSTLVMGGDTANDVIFVRDYEVPGSVAYISDWNTLPNITLENEWWYPDATGVFNIGGKLIAATNSMSLSCVSRASGFAFNKTIYNKYNFEKSIYDYVYEDKWTLDVFQTLASSVYEDVDGDGDYDDTDVYGIGQSSYKEIFARFINGAGVSFISKDEQGYPVFTLPNEEVNINKMMRIMELAQDKTIYNNPDKSNMNSATAYGDLTKNTALFRLCHAKAMSSTLRDADIEYGFVPNPKYDETQDRYYSTTWAFEIMTLPKTLAEDQKDNVGLLLEALAFDSHTSVLERYKEEAVKSKYAQSQDDYNMLDIAFKTMSFDLGAILWEGPIVNKLIQEIYAKDGGTIASTFASQKKMIEKTLEQFAEDVQESVTAEGNG